MQHLAMMIAHLKGTIGKNFQYSLRITFLYNKVAVIPGKAADHNEVGA